METIETEITHSAKRVIASARAELERLAPGLTGDQLALATLGLDLQAAMHVYRASRDEQGLCRVETLKMLAQSVGDALSAMIFTTVGTDTKGQSMAGQAVISMLGFVIARNFELGMEPRDGAIAVRETVKVHHA